MKKKMATAFKDNCKVDSYIGIKVLDFVFENLPAPNEIAEFRIFRKFRWNFGRKERTKTWNFGQILTEIWPKNEFSSIFQLNFKVLNLFYQISAKFNSFRPVNTFTGLDRNGRISAEIRFSRAKSKSLNEYDVLNPLN